MVCLALKRDCPDSMIERGLETAGSLPMAAIRRNRGFSGLDVVVVKRAAELGGDLPSESLSWCHGGPGQNVPMPDRPRNHRRACPAVSGS